MVWTRQKDGICHEVWGPAARFGLSPSLEKQAVHQARKLSRAIGLHGVFALEWFWTPQLKTKLWVNEIAPRVHNSGHFTLDAAHTSQFENHLRASLGRPLGSTETLKEFGMLNLLGKARRLAHPPKFKLPASAHLHWYGKTEERPGRKMGHIGFDSVQALRYFSKSS
jgi:5-(carboxyamino)imidazole ribonucleotide synthase